MTLENTSLENSIAIVVTLIAYHVAFFGLLYSCWLLIRDGVMRLIVQETTKVTTMVFTILIGSLFLSLVVRSFGGELYIQEFLPPAFPSMKHESCPLIHLIIKCLSLQLSLIHI